MSLAEHLEKQNREQKDEGADAQSESDTPEKFVAPPMETPPPDKPTEPSVLLRLWNRKLWVFPWSYFIEAEYFPQCEGGEAGKQPEQIRIVFGAREIVLLGRNLAGLMELIARHRIVELRQVHEKFVEANHSPTDPVIVSAEIRARPK